MPCRAIWPSPTLPTTNPLLLKSFFASGTAFHAAKNSAHSAPIQPTWLYSQMARPMAVPTDRSRTTRSGSSIRVRRSNVIAMFPPSRGRIGSKLMMPQPRADPHEVPEEHVPAVRGEEQHGLLCVITYAGAERNDLRHRARQADHDVFADARVSPAVREHQATHAVQHDAGRTSVQSANDGVPQFAHHDRDEDG